MKNLWSAAAKVALAVAWSVVSLRATIAQESPGEGPPERPITAAERDHWAYRPIAEVEIPRVAEGPWNAHPVDRFLKAEMDERSVEPLPRAGRAALMRRLFVDLTGLAPTPREAREFLDDTSPGACEALVDRLLASPAYGERWAQHWLDLARYADTDGFEHDLVRPNAWRYRDWVIEALNRDMPFDEFVRLQVAGDLLRPGDPVYYDILQSYMGYRTCYYRCFAIGFGSHAMVDAYKRCRDYLDAAIDLIRPGRTTADVAAVWPKAQ